MPYDHQFFTKGQSTSMRSAEIVVPIVTELLSPRSVVDVGCGTGTWLSAFAQTGVEDFLGIDGGHVPAELLLIPKERFRSSDLRAGLACERQFDLAISLEVAEHLPPECAERFVTDLTALAPCILFSAAIPFQSGHEHLNEQWPSYWARLFGRHGYRAVDCVRDRVWNYPEVEWWYAQNTLLFATQEVIASNHRLAAMVATSDHLSRVHPLNYLTKADPQYMSLRWTLQRALQLTRSRSRRAVLRDQDWKDVDAAKTRELKRLAGGKPA